jgi:small subunit ribosomal protein S8
MDTIANLLTSIRNAEMASHSTVTVPTSKMKKAIVEILKENGYVGASTEENGSLTINLIKTEKLRSYRRISKPGRRMYTDAKKIPTVLGGRGLIILSTPEGVLSGKEARKRGIGGEIICEVY